MRILSDSDDQKPTIERAAVLDFFEQRAAKAKSLGPVRAVIYQDKHPDLAERRDRAEKSLLFPKVQAGKQDHILDVGCGTGRWAGDLIPFCAEYHGADISPGLIEIARSTYDQYPNARFSVCPVDQVSLPALGRDQPFTRILCFGVLMYMNDDEALRALQAISRCAAPETRIVVREPISVTHRLTIKDHFSTDMDQTYNAIYRTEEEITHFFDTVFGSAGFKLVEEGDVYAEADLNNRSDTKQKYFILVR